MTSQQIGDSPLAQTSWDHTLNNPDDLKLSPGSHKKVWWLCDLDHSYETSIQVRIRANHKCPYCSRRKALKGFNDISVTHPAHAAEWHPTKNSSSATDHLAGSHKKVWWQDSFGHEWETKITGRISQNTGCPVCSNRKILAGYNDLGSSGQPYAKQWHPTKNILLVTEVAISSGKKIWWLCEKNHEWEAKINDRKNGQGCPFCSRLKFIEGEDGLNVTHPHLAEEWHPTKNGDLKPERIKAGNHNKAWWLGKCGHEWETLISYRGSGVDCPYCSNREILSGFNDLATVMPEVAAEFHPSKNRGSIPSEILQNSKKIFWWQDSFGHEWETSVDKRRTVYKNKWESCPYCANRLALAGFNDLETTEPLLASQWHPTKNGELKPTDVTAGSTRRVWWTCEKSHAWDTKISDRHVYKTGCPTCSEHYRVSKGEKEIFDYLTAFLPVESSNRKILQTKELDMYIPSKNVAIEFNGLYWHNETRKIKTYHYDKWLECKQKGIQLIQIWEDDWKSNPQLILNMLAYKLDLKTSAQVYARKTNAIVLSKSQAESFLTRNHIQGFASGTYYLGLISEENELVTVIVLKKDKDLVFNIIRFASSANVIGGFTKLLKYAERMYSPRAFVTFSDNTISTGGLYEKNGFVAVKYLPSDYMYILKGVRKHKFGYRKTKFKTDPTLDYVEGYTEKELATLNGLVRIWDAGKIKWERKTS